MNNRDVVKEQEQRNMAEAAVESPAVRFFCHRCTQEISPVLPDYICPRCQSGFIEEVGGQQNESEEPEDYFATNADPAPDLWHFLSVMRRLEDAHPMTGAPSDPREARLNINRPGPSRRIRYRTPRRNNDPEASRSRTEGFIQQIVNQLSENSGLIPPHTFPVFLNLHGNPGDYAWGRGSWNAIITQLINQLDGTGPPPLPKEKIEEIPIVEISQEQVDKNLQCTVCMEDFEKLEPVRRLACDHHFHNGCIIPWLELHGTCPICRKLLNDSSPEGGASASSSVELVDLTTTSNDPIRNNDTTPVNSRSPNVYDFRDEYD